MSTLDSILLPPGALVRDALTQIDVGASQLAIIVDDQRRVIGVVTDGDVRRGLLAGVTLDDTVERIMNRNPKLVSVDASDEEIQALMRREVIHQVPIVDGEGRIVALRTIDTFVAADRLENTVVLMAGGLGKRLRPLTETVPKPMLPVGGRPLLETLVQSFVDQGFYRFAFSVNYRAEAIEAHFGDGYRFGAEIAYLRETDALGTAGSLSLMPNRPGAPFFERGHSDFHQLSSHARFSQGKRRGCDHGGVRERLRYPLRRRRSRRRPAGRDPREADAQLLHQRRDLRP